MEPRAKPVNHPFTRCSTCHKGQAASERLSESAAHRRKQDELERHLHTKPNDRTGRSGGNRHSDYSKTAKKLNAMTATNRADSSCDGPPQANLIWPAKRTFETPQAVNSTSRQLLLE